jgi:hypothetical protein
MGRQVQIGLHCMYGDSERIEGERFFNDLNETLFRDVLASHPDLELVELWKTDDLRRLDRREQRWLNAIVKKVIASLWSADIPSGLRTG